MHDIRLRLEIPVINLADRFQISKTTAAVTLLDVLDILYVKTSPLFIDRPTNLTAHNLTWSNYKVIILASI